MSTDRPSHLIEAAQLAQRQSTADAPLVIFDCRHDLARPDWGREQFAAAHIPGARFAHLDHDLSGPVSARSGRHPLPDPDTLAAFLGNAGVEATTQVVVYDQDKSMIAARLWWLLRWLGHERVAVLNGGFAAWQAARLPLESSLAPRPAARFIRRPALGHTVTTQEVQRDLRAGHTLLLDARAADRFAGQNETIDPVAGHVPGARNHPFTLNLGADGRLLPDAELAQHWRAQLGATPARNVVAMCGSGVTACHNLLALELAGLPGARLYAGSFSEWIRDPAREVVTGPA